MRTFILVFSLFLMSCSCDSDESSAPTAAQEPVEEAGGLDTEPSEGGLQADASAGEGGGADGDAPAVDPPASEYCERAAEVFCPYYIRCERMVAADLATCLETFVPACNSRFEPLYAELADRGLLTLSGEGLSACQEHLAAVSCEQQVFDLDLGCSGVWRGEASEGQACGPGIESFVCAEGTTCVLDLTFCGSCQSTVGLGEPCGTGPDEESLGRCEATASCTNGVCTARILAGEPCEPGVSTCVAGADCIDSGGGATCTGRAWSKPGEPCGQTAQCQYKSECVEGACAETSLVGGPCSAVLPCAAGYCTAAGTCEPMQSKGGACEDNAQCDTRNCQGGLCATLVTTCLE